MKEKIIVHLIVEDSGFIAKNLLNLAFAHFPQLELKTYSWASIKTQLNLTETFTSISKKPGIIFYHLTDQHLEKKLLMQSSEQNWSAISLTGWLVAKIAELFQTTPAPHVSKTFNNEYFAKIDAIDFSIKHDDGQNIDTLNQSDIILIGQSRSSKTPTSMYLAFNGLRVANIPFIDEVDLERYLLKIRNNYIIGLTINPARLMHVRENRMVDLGHEFINNGYVDLSIIRDECSKFRSICEKFKWPVVDVTSKSVEETAAEIMRLYYTRPQK